MPVEVEDLLKQVTSDLANQINALVVQLNTMAIKTAERRVAEVMAGARETQEQADAELRDAAATVEDLESKLDGLQLERQELQRKLETADQKYADSKSELTPWSVIWLC